METLQKLNFNEPPRPYLGMSTSGDECLRRRWYTFRWCKQEYFTARQLRLFKRGHREEKYFIRGLRWAGYKVLDVDPKTGKQFEIIACHGHAKGHTDGEVFLNPSTPSLLECKTHADKYFKPLVKKGVKEAYPSHYAQMQRYMIGMGYSEALYCAVNKNDETYHFEIVPFNETDADLLVRKEEEIVLSDKPLERMSEDKLWYKCGFAWCIYRDICHFGDVPDKNCRTCANGAVSPEGEWTCERGGILSYREQLKGCDDYEILSGLQWRK